MARMPTAEIDVTPDLVGDLLAHQHPDLLGGRTIAPFANGWDNAMLRLGDDLLVRLPRRELAAGLVEHEQAWLPRLVPRLPVAIPAPVRIGSPEGDYPWSWSVVPWHHGVPLGELPQDRRRGVAAELASFLAALHTPADDDVWRSPYRGGTLTDRAAMIEDRIAAAAGARAEPLLARWREVIASPDPTPQPRLWVHGDLHPLNILVDDGGPTLPSRLTAVIDWGDITAGEPACDLAIAWLGFDAEGAAILRAAYDGAVTHDLDLDALWRRAEAWAFHLATMMLSSSDDHPALAAIGRHGLSRLDTDVT